MNLRLPNLAPLAGDSQLAELFFQTDPNGIVKIAQFDPMRWAVIVTSNFTGNNYVTTKPDVLQPIGIGVPHNGPLELIYSKYLAFCQQDLWYITDNPIHTISVVIIRSTPRG